MKGENNNNIDGNIKTEEEKIMEEAQRNASIKNGTFNIDDDTPDNERNFSKLSNREKEEIKKKEKKIIEIDRLSKVPNIEIEKSIIYILLTTKENPINIITEYGIKPDYFISDIGKKIYNLILDIFGKKGKIDVLLLTSEYKKTIKKEDEIKLLNQMISFNGFPPKKDLIREYAFILADNYNKDKLNNLVLNLENAIKLNDNDRIAGLKYEIENFQLIEEDDSNPDVGLIDNALLAEQAIKWIDGEYKTKNTSLKTGFIDYDDKVGGFEKATMTVFLARPSVGKSVALINSMYGCVKNGANCLYVSAEMYAKYVFSRWGSIDQEISNTKLRQPNKLSTAEHKKMKKFYEKYKNEKNAHFMYEPIVTARDIEMRAKEIKAKTGKPLDAIFVDYLGKLYPNNLDMTRSRNDIVGDISRELFGLGGNLNVAMVTATQLNRASAKNADQESLVPPTMSDIRDSGSVAQDADVLIGITRDFIAGSECYTEDQYTDFNWHIIKNRNGEVGNLTLNFHPVMQKLKNATEDFDIETAENLGQKGEAIKQDKLIKDILKENDVFSQTKDIFD